MRALLMVMASFASFLILAPAARSDEDCDDDNDWPMYNYDGRGTRYNTAEHTLSRWNAGKLRQLWNVNTPAPVTATPTAVGDKLFVGDWSGRFYQLSQHSGHVDWTFQSVSEISATALVLHQRVIFGDQQGYIYGLQRDTGAARWRIRPNTHDQSAIFSSPIPVGKNVALGIASNEEIAAGDPNYPCCSFRGSVVLFDPDDGHLQWQTYLISDAESKSGASGAGVWVTPTYDKELDLIYVASGNNYSAPANGMSDAVIALDARTGQIRWSAQEISYDISNFSFPIEPGRDDDFGDSVQIYRLPNGRKVVGSGNKNGVYFVLDAATGALINDRQVQGGGSLGGLFADSAVANGVVYANGGNWLDPFDFSVLPTGGLLTAIKGDASSVVWQVTVPQEVALSGVSVANDVIYFATCNPGTGDRLTSSGHVIALDSHNGAELAFLPVGNCANSGPAVSHGRVFVGLGNEFLFAGNPTGNIVAFGL